jgi:hypothetical protein
MLRHAEDLEMRIYLTIFALVLMAIPAAAGQTTTIEGFLAAADAGTHINGAFVLLHDYTTLPSEPEYTSHNMEMRTGADGHFTFKVDAGCYDLFVSAMWFAPLSERICIRAGQTTKVKLRMKADRRTNLRID